MCRTYVFPYIFLYLRISKLGIHSWEIFWKKERWIRALCLLLSDPTRLSLLCQQFVSSTQWPWYHCGEKGRSCPVTFVWGGLKSYRHYSGCKQTIYYCGVHINPEALALLPEDGDISGLIIFIDTRVYQWRQQPGSANWLWRSLWCSLGKNIWPHLWMSTYWARNYKAVSTGTTEWSSPYCTSNRHMAYPRC